MDRTVTARLPAFLVEAKRRTYAGLDDDATVAAPIIPGSKQLESRSGDLAYRDIYFGIAYFVGQEVVSADQQAIWSMSYAGDITEPGAIRAIYAFLRQAMLLVREERPFRGPSQFEDGDYRYADTSQGGVSDFCGAE
jgi:hypothetical protein